MPKYAKIVSLNINILAELIEIHTGFVFCVFAIHTIILMWSNITGIMENGL